MITAFEVVGIIKRSDGNPIPLGPRRILETELGSAFGTKAAAGFFARAKLRRRLILPGKVLGRRPGPAQDRSSGGLAAHQAMAVDNGQQRPLDTISVAAAKATA